MTINGIPYEMLRDVDDHKEQEFHFDWGVDYQRSILAMLMADRVFLLQSFNLIKPEYFTDKAHRKISEVLFEHFREYRNIPTKAIFEKEMADVLKDEKTRLYYLSELKHLYNSYEPGVESREYHQKSIYDFARMVALKRAWHRGVEELKKKPDDSTWAKIDKWLDEARLVDFKFEIGLDYFDSVKDRYIGMKVEKENVEVFTTGFRSIDDEMTAGGMRRGEIHSFMSPPGVGKSLCLVKAAVENVKAHKKVLYISLEMNEYDIAARFDAQLACVSIKELIENEQIVESRLGDYVYGMEDRRLLIIKQFPSGTADVNTIRAYLHQISLMGWIPDLLIVDYLGEMRDIPGIPIHESREQLTKGLRGLGSEYQMCVMTAMQPNRAAKAAMQDGGVISDDNLGDSYGQLRPLDGLYTINQTDNEKKAGVARIYVAKQRSGTSRYTFFVEVQNDPLTLSFRVISENTYRVRMSKVVEKDADNVKKDEIYLNKRLDDTVKRYKPSNPEEE